MLHPRARTMLLLATPALIIGIASSLVLIVVMKVASVLQTFFVGCPAGKARHRFCLSDLDYPDADPHRYRGRLSHSF